MEECNEDSGTTDGGKDCLRDHLSGSTQDAKEAEFKKSAEKKLGELINNIDKEEQDYRAAYQGFKEKWNELEKKIRKLKDHFEECYDYQCFIEKVVCKKVICKEWELRKELLQDKLCGRYKDLYLADEELAEGQKQLEAWEKITAWLKDRLEKNAALYDKICKLDNCQDRYFAIYILYFELCPAHDAMGPPPEYPQVYDPAEKYCISICACPPEKGGAEFCGYPWLIDPDKLNCKIAEVWEIWKKLGIAEVTAQCRVDEIEKCRKQYEELANSETRRNTAREEFQRFDPCCCKKRSSGPDTPQQSTYTP